MQPQIDSTSIHEVGSLSRSEPQGLIDSLARFGSLSRLLRIFGATVLVASISIFLLQGWAAGNDVQRYSLLLAHTVLLTATGFASSRWIKESNGARLFLALALVSVPVNFAILGGLLYSQVQWDTALRNYPDFATWQVDTLPAALFTIAGASVVLVPVIWLGFLALGRRSARHLTLLYLFANAALLVPVRGTQAVGALIVVGTAIILAQIARAARRDPTLRTSEGLFARVLQFLPIGIVAGRSLYLYAADAFLSATAAIVVFIVLRQITGLMAATSRMRRFLEGLSLIPAGVAATSVTAALAKAGPGADPFLLPVCTTVFSMLAFEISLRSAAGGANYRRFASVVLVAGMLANLFLYGSVATAAACLLVGLAVAVYGYTVQQRIIFTLGLITLLTGLGHQLSYAVHMFDLGSWSSLALIGIAAIVTASVLERHGAALKVRFGHWRLRFQSWEY